MLNMFLQFLFTAGAEARPLRECTRTRSTSWMLIFVVGVGKVMLAKLAGAYGRERFGGIGRNPAVENRERLGAVEPAFLNTSWQRPKCQLSTRRL